MAKPYPRSEFCRLLALCAALAAGAARAEEPPAVPEATPPAEPAPAAPAAAPASAPEAARWEGAIGPVLRLEADYAGSSHRKLGGVPGFYLRYGRYSISNTGAFVTRRRDDVVRGLGADVHLTDTVRTSLGLRLERARPSDERDALRGLEGQRTTVRLRAATTWTPGTRHVLEGWGFTLAASTDLLGRGGGQTLDMSAGRGQRLSERLVWNSGISLSAASAAYLQRRFGVTAEESQRTGYAAYTPGAGLHDVNLSTGWRMEIDPQWVAFWGVSAGRLLGPAARSPLTEQPRHWELNGGIAWRF